MDFLGRFVWKLLTIESILAVDTVLLISSIAKASSGYTSLNSCQIKLNFNFSCNPFLAVCVCVKIHKHPFGKYILNTTIYINDRFVHLFRNAKLNTVKWVHFNEPRTGSMMRNDELISNYIFLQLFSLQLMSIFEMLCNIYANTYHNIIIIMYKCTVLTLFEFSMDFMTKTGLISNFQTQKNIWHI